MPFVTSRLHDFRGQQLSLRQISRITGLSRGALKMRVCRGTALDAPLRVQVPKKRRPVKPHLTGDWWRDVTMIVRWMHQRLAKSGGLEYGPDGQRR